MHEVPGNNKTIGDKLIRIKEQLFIERVHERDLFEGALNGAERHWHILNIHGPGGIGKSALLDAYRRMCDQHDVPYHYFDISHFSGQPQRLLQHCATSMGLNEAALKEVLHAIVTTANQRTMVLAFDAYEESGELNRWLRENFFVHLPKNCLIVIAGRYPLVELWKHHGAWHRLIEAVALTNFTREESLEYLRTRGVTDPALCDQMWRNSNGFPLVLSLNVMLAERDGPEAIAGFANNPNIVSELTSRWLREIGDPKLRALIEAAAITRFFNQELISAIVGEPVSENEFRQLVATSFIRPSSYGWSITGMMRLALANELNHRLPEHYNTLRVRALHVLAQLAINPFSSLDRCAALHEFFYLLGDSLVRAALYSEEIDPRPELHIESAAGHDIPALEQYMDAWRHERGLLAPIAVDLFDRSNSRTITQKIISEPREPEFINVRELVESFPGSIRVLEDNTNTLHGLSIVMPINGGTLEYLRQQPVTGGYFSNLGAAELNEYDTPVEETSNWFVRLIDTRDPADNSARAVLFRDLTAMLIRPARFITTTPLELYQSLLCRFGFTRLATPPHHDFGRERPSPYFMLDLRGENLARYLQEMITRHVGEPLQLPFESLLAAMPGAARRQPPLDVQRRQLLERLTGREREVALLAIDGLPNCTIAARLDVSEATVKKHMGNIFEKLGVRKRSELIKTFWASP